MKELSILQCIKNTDLPWWKCPSTIILFCVFLIIFAYSIYISIECTYLINQYAKYNISDMDIDFQSVYKKSLGTINSTYVMSNLMCLLSGIVIFGFIMKTIPESQIGNIFSYSTGIILALYIFIFSAFTLSTFSGMNYVLADSIVGFSAFILICSLVVIALFSYQIYVKTVKKV